MGTVIYAINFTVDGCCDHTKMVGDEETLKHYIELLQSVDVQIFGRKTYEIMVPYWPDVAKDPTEGKASKDFANAFCALDRIVFSRTLTDVQEKGTNIARSNLKDEVIKLKQEGKRILAGGVDVPMQLIAMGLVDEFHFLVQPFFVGEARHLSEGLKLPERLKLTLVESQVFPSGSVMLHYRKQ